MALASVHTNTFCLLGTIVTCLSPLSCSAEGRLTLSDAHAEVGAKNLEHRSTGGDRSTGLAKLRFKENTCNGYDLSPEKDLLTIDSLKAHLRYRAISFTVTPERDDLHLFDLDIKGEKAQLRVATLKSSREAGRHLHTALLEHGQGYWGVHRGNLAVLAPAGSANETTGFAIKTGLLCWGVYTQAGRDDTFVIPGGYFEL